ncbi:glycosyltransferase family 2 protein [Thetidibacter halocola]|uniref:Glycosyltransferase family 2 protein n=1 Tax=Thetidibacter halocola TaxID=2827239 RepID=A0A8J7WGK9_9RHOB|nr:glycosyltransferase family 2 protein [Thetidibacter halocola]MBS0124928.1 glycosyltransferase family 2 protein [Thetidibacter halocola]
MNGSGLRVGAVVLTYNSTEDLPDCLAGLIAQRGVDLRVIVVDNASCPGSRARMEADFLAAFPGGSVIEADGARGDADAALPAVFLRNAVNAGYSAGNNIGARLAAAIGCDAVLVVNPDVRITDPDYVRRLAALIVADPKAAVTCSALSNLSGAQENPMTEPGFVEELLWPVSMLVAGLSRRRKASPPLPEAPCRVAKVSGACFLVRVDFLRQVGFFDESVFLYCEESILMAQVRAAGWHMMMDPGIHALHAHRGGAKGDPLPRFRLWMQSRSRFHEAHGGYGALRRTLLAGSRSASLGLVRGRTLSRRLRDYAAGTRVGRKD